MRIFVTIVVDTFTLNLLKVLTYLQKHMKCQDVMCYFIMYGVNSFHKVVSGAWSQRKNNPFDLTIQRLEYP